MPTRTRHNLAAFTLIELMVAVGLLVIVIVSVGVVFKATGNAVGLGQATGDMFAKVRVINQQINADVHGIDRNGFLIIRCRHDISDPQRLRRIDQISFISTGKFPNRTGAYQNANVFADGTTSNSARIWYGQLDVEKDTAGNNQTSLGADDQVPTSAIADTKDPAYESGFWLGRQAMLLLNPPAAGVTIFPAGYNSIFRTGNTLYTSTTHATDAGPDSSSVPAITASRIDVAYSTAPQIMQVFNAAGVSATVIGNYCYRLKTLPSPTSTLIQDASGAPYLPNGVLRMHPVLAAGVPSFAVDWTDGNVDGNNDLKWYGLNTGTAGNYALASTETAQVAGGPDGVTGTNDQYSAVFTSANASSWPKALRFTYRITDSNDRLNGGRSFVCVVDLP